MGSFHDYETIAALCSQPGVSRETLARHTWKIAGSCERPVTFDLFGRPTQWTSEQLMKLPKEYRKAFIASGLLKPTHQVLGFDWDRGRNHPLWLIMEVPCRKCAACRRARARKWASKAMDEIGRSSRTWFATYTLTPDEHFAVESAARLAEAEQGFVFERLDEEKQFFSRCRVFSPAITRYIKRIRKQSGTRIRYLWVAERHASGLPHYHALVHEVCPDKPLRKAVLKAQWPHGFSRFKLVENAGAAWYVCKYLTKDQATRVRGSLHYGLTS